MQTKNLTAIEALQEEMTRLTKKANECVTDYGFVITSRREEYQTLVSQLREIRESIQYLQRLKNKIA